MILYLRKKIAGTLVCMGLVTGLQPSSSAVKHPDETEHPAATAESASDTRYELLDVSKKGAEKGLLVDKKVKDGKEKTAAEEDSYSLIEEEDKPKKAKK